MSHKELLQFVLHLEELQVCRSVPQEDIRLIVTQEYLERHIALMRTHLIRKLCELVFNLGEVGSSDREDRARKKVIVPRAASRDAIYHVVSRRYQNMTLLAFISASCDALTPMIISQAPIRDCSWSRGLRQDEDVMVRQMNPAHIDEELFHEHIPSVFIPCVINLQNDARFSGEIAVCLMDFALAHQSQRCLRLLGENRLLAGAFPAHTTHIFKKLDLISFGARKHLKPSCKGESCDRSVNDQVAKLVQAYEQTATSGTIRGSFQKVDLIQSSTTDRLSLRGVRDSGDRLCSSPRQPTGCGSR
jgi:hypothetical protein